MLLNKAQREFHEMFTRTYGKSWKGDQFDTFFISRRDVPEERRSVPRVFRGPEDVLRQGQPQSSRFDGILFYKPLSENVQGTFSDLNTRMVYH